MLLYLQMIEGMGVPSPGTNGSRESVAVHLAMRGFTSAVSFKDLYEKALEVMATMQDKLFSAAEIASAADSSRKRRRSTVGSDRCAIVNASVAVLAEILLRTPRKLFIFIIRKYIYRMKVSRDIPKTVN